MDKIDEPLRLRPQKNIVFKPINGLKKSAILDYQTNQFEESCIADAEQGIFDIEKTEEQMKLVLLYTRLRLQPDPSMVMPNKNRLKRKAKHIYYNIMSIVAAVLVFFGIFIYWTNSEQNQAKKQIVNINNNLVSKPSTIVQNTNTNIAVSHSKNIVPKKHLPHNRHHNNTIDAVPHKLEDQKEQKERLVYDYLPPIEDVKIETSIAITSHQTYAQQFTQAINNQPIIRYTEPYTIRKLVEPLFAYNRKKRDQTTITHLINNENYGKQIEISADKNISQPSVTRYYSSAGELVRTEIKINN